MSSEPHVCDIKEMLYDYFKRRQPECKVRSILSFIVTSNKNNINSSCIDGYSDVDFLNSESGLILLINQTYAVVIRQGSWLKELTASQRPRGERQDLMLQSPEPFNLTA